MNIQPTTLKNIPTIITQILSDMEDCIHEQEIIVLEEREAMQTFNAGALTALVERRARSQSTLSELEHQCQVLCAQIQHIPNKDKRMALIIDHFAPENADMLQTMRIDLVRRMQTLERDHVENHIRLRAAWNVTTNILQHIGAIEAPSTYNTYTTQAAR